MNDVLTKIWAGLEPEIVKFAILIGTGFLAAVSFKVLQYFNDIRKDKAITNAVAAVQMTSPPGTPPEDKRAAAQAIIAEDPRVRGKATPTELEAAVLSVKSSMSVPCPPAEGSGG